MIPWIQVYSNLPYHPKTSRLADELKLTSAAVNPNAIAVGMLISLWTWAVQNAYNGDLSKCSARAIADACQCKKKPEVLLNALLTSGWLDEDMTLHDWEQYAVLLMDAEDNKRARTNERVKRYRDRKKAESETPNTGVCNADVTVTGALHVTDQELQCNVTDTRCNAPTIHNITIHNNTDSLKKERKERNPASPPVSDSYASLLSSREKMEKSGYARYDGYGLERPINGVPDEQLPSIKSKLERGVQISVYDLNQARKQWRKDHPAANGGNKP